MSNGGKVGLIALALVAALGCGDDDEPVAEPEPTPETEPEPATPLSCTLEGEPILLPGVSGPTAITPVGDAFVVASFAQTEDDGEDFWMGRVARGAEPVELAKLSVTAGENQFRRHPNSTPALTTIDERTVGVAVVGRAGEVSAGRLDLSTDPPTLKLAPVENGARRTDPPAMVSAGDRLAVAWTQASTYEPMDFGGYACGFPWDDSPPEPPAPPEPLHGHQVRLALVDADGTVHTRRDATPRVEGAQAIAPVVIEGADPPAVAFLDPRAGIGTVHRVGVRAEGFVEPETVRPLSNLRDQTDLAAADGPGGPWLAYSAVGNGATTAIGLVSLANTTAPTPLVPGTGYRPLRVAGAATGNAAVFAAEAPKDDGQSAPTEIRVRAVNEAGPGDPLVLGDQTPESDESDAESSDEPSTPTPSARVGVPSVRGSLSRDEVRQVLREHVDEVRICHARGLAHQPALRGSVRVRFVISPTGAVQTSLVQRSDLGDEAVEGCIARAIHGWTFPEPDGDIAVVDSRFLLRPDGGPPLPATPIQPTAFSPAIAARESDGLLAVAYSTTAGVRVAWVRCR